MSLDCYPPGMSNEDLTYFDSPDEEFYCTECGCELDYEATLCPDCEEASDGEEN